MVMRYGLLLGRNFNGTARLEKIEPLVAGIFRIDTNLDKVVLFHLPPHVTLRIHISPGQVRQRKLVRWMNEHVWHFHEVVQVFPVVRNDT